MDRRDFQRLSGIRLREAKSLLKLRLTDGAYYLAGYSVECALKACISKRTRRHDFPDKKRAEASHTHNLLQLVNESGLKRTIAVLANDDPEFRKNWDLVQLWSEQSRYEAHSAERAKAFLTAVGDRKHGILACIKQHW